MAWSESLRVRVLPDQKSRSSSPLRSTVATIGCLLQLSLRVAVISRPLVCRSPPAAPTPPKGACFVCADMQRCLEFPGFSASGWSIGRARRGAAQGGVRGRVYYRLALNNFSSVIYSFTYLFMVPRVSGQGLLPRNQRVPVEQGRVAALPAAGRAAGGHDGGGAGGRGAAYGGQAAAAADDAGGGAAAGAAASFLIHGDGGCANVLMWQTCVLKCCKLVVKLIPMSWALTAALPVRAVPFSCWQPGFGTVSLFPDSTFGSKVLNPGSTLVFENIAWGYEDS